MVSFIKVNVLSALAAVALIAKQRSISGGSNTAETKKDKEALKIVFIKRKVAGLISYTTY